MPFVLATAMVLPFLLAGAALAAGGFGIGKGARAVNRVNQAKNLGEQAEGRYLVRRKRLETAREGCQGALERLGRIQQSQGIARCHQGWRAGHIL
jgi:hypothetical protein